MRSETVNAFCSTVSSNGYRTGIYSSQSFLRNNIANETLLPHYIWLASYTRYNRLPSYDGHYNIWQYTDGGTVNGIRGKVDMNVIY